MVAVLVGINLLPGISIGSLLPSIAIGLFLGALKQVAALRRLSDHPVFTAFIGAEWRRDRPTATAIDIAAALVVSYAVGVAVLWATAGNDSSAAWFPLVMAGGSGGGDGASFVAILMAWILF